jgi:predicted O-linked N-acetylglucosamine transferase (SPINDLY family)
LRERFAGLGIDAERLTFLGNQPELAEHLSWYRKVDVALDTVPYEGLAQTCDALWLGVPVISMAGENGYIRRAAQLAKDHQVLATLRKALRKRMSRSLLRDEEGFAADVGAAFRGMWQAWCKGK